MKCAKCGAKVDSGAARYCAACGEPAREPGTVWKGELVATLRPPFELFGRYGMTGWLAGGTLVTLFAVSLIFGWTQVSLTLLGCLFFGMLFFLNRVVFVLSSVRVYKNGLEQDIRRSWNKSAYLAWERLTESHWEGDILRYTWPRDGLMILRDGQWPSSWPLLYFPKALRVPARQVEQIRKLLAKAQA